MNKTDFLKKISLFTLYGSIVFFLYYFIFWYLDDFAGFSFIRSLKNAIGVSFLGSCVICGMIAIQKQAKSLVGKIMAKLLLLFSGIVVLFLFFYGIGSYGTGAYDFCMQKCQGNISDCMFHICDFPI